MPILEFGPDTNGWLRIWLNNSFVGDVVWVGDKSLPGYGSYPQNGLVYWLWSGSPPFPAQDFTLFFSPAPPPAHSPAMIAFPNEAFSEDKVLENELTLTVSPPQVAYEVTPAPNSDPPTRYGLISNPGAGGFTLQWSASANKPPDQPWFWPHSSPNATLAFRHLSQTSHVFPVGTTFFPVTETETE